VIGKQEGHDRLTNNDSDHAKTAETFEYNHRTTIDIIMIL